MGWFFGNSGGHSQNETYAVLEKLKGALEEKMVSLLGIPQGNQGHSQRIALRSEVEALCKKTSEVLIVHEENSIPTNELKKIKIGNSDLKTELNKVIKTLEHILQLIRVNPSLVNKKGQKEALHCANDNTISSANGNSVNNKIAHLQKKAA